MFSRKTLGAKRDDSLRELVAKQTRETRYQTRTREVKDYHSSHNAMQQSRSYFNDERRARNESSGLVGTASSGIGVDSSTSSSSSESMDEGGGESEEEKAAGAGDE